MTHKMVFGIEVRTELREDDPTTAVLSFDQHGYSFSGSVVPQTLHDARGVRYEVAGYWPTEAFQLSSSRNAPKEIHFSAETPRSIETIEVGLKFAKRLLRNYTSKSVTPPTTFGGQVALIAALVGVEVVIVRFADQMERMLYHRESVPEKGLESTPSLRSRSMGSGWPAGLVFDLRTGDKDDVGMMVDRYVSRGLQEARNAVTALMTPSAQKA